MDKPQKKKREKKFSLKKRAESFSFALSGIGVLFRSQHNARIHLVSGISAVGLGLWLEISFLRLSVLVLCVTIVWAAEAFNTAIEMLINMITSERTWPAKWAKDVSAAAVLFVAFGAAVVGLLILGPPLYRRLLNLL